MHGLIGPAHGHGLARVGQQADKIRVLQLFLQRKSRVQAARLGLLRLPDRLLGAQERVVHRPAQGSSLRLGLCRPLLLAFLAQGAAHSDGNGALELRAELAHHQRPEALFARGVRLTRFFHADSSSCPARKYPSVCI